MKKISVSPNKSVEIGAFIGFSFFTLLGILTHEMWRDELQAWMISRDSNSIFELIKNLEYEGTPALWHLCLYGLSQISRNPLTMQLFHWGIALGTVYLVLKYSPFSTAHKVLLSFSYFIFYEYTVVSRNYSIAVFLSFFFCTLYCRFKTRLRIRYFVLACLLGLIANVNVYAFIISVILAFFLLIEAWKQPGLYRRTYLLERTASMGGVGVSWLVASWQIGRVKFPDLNDYFLIGNLDNGMGSPMLGALLHWPLSLIGVHFPEYRELSAFEYALTGIWNSYIPIPPLFQLEFWNQNILTHNFYYPRFLGISLVDGVVFVLSILLVVFVGYIFFQKPTIFWTYILGTASIVGFQTVIHFASSSRHDGHYWLVLILCAWLYMGLYPLEPNTLESSPRYQEANPDGRFKRSSSPFYKLMPAFLSVVLSIQALSGWYAMGIDYRYPFAPGKAAADFIIENNLINLPIAGRHYAYTSTVSGYLDVPVYYYDRKEMGTFWTTQPSDIRDDKRLFDEIAGQVESAPDQKLILIWPEPLSFSEDLNNRNINVDLLASFQRSIVPKEKLSLYLAQKAF